MRKMIQSGWSICDCQKAFIINVNKCLKTFFLEQHINSVNTVTLQGFFLFICNGLFLLVLYYKLWIAKVYSIKPEGRIHYR